MPEEKLLTQTGGAAVMLELLEPTLSGAHSETTGVFGPFLQTARFGWTFSFYLV